MTELGTNEILTAPPLSPATHSATQRNEHMSTKAWIEFFILMYPLSPIAPRETVEEFGDLSGGHKYKSFGSFGRLSPSGARGGVDLTDS